MKDIKSKILPHFDKYSLITQKQADYLLFKKVIELMEKKEHLTIVGIKNIINIRASMNLGLTSVLRESFPNFESAIRPVIHDNEIPDSYWMAGFVSGEGLFYISIVNNKKFNKKYIQLKFSISQHMRDKNLFQKK